MIGAGTIAAIGTLYVIFKKPRTSGLGPSTNPSSQPTKQGQDGSGHGGLVNQLVSGATKTAIDYGSKLAADAITGTAEGVATGAIIAVENLAKSAAGAAQDVAGQVKKTASKGFQAAVRGLKGEIKAIGEGAKKVIKAGTTGVSKVIDFIPAGVSPLVQTAQLAKAKSRELRIQPFGG